MYKYIGIRGHRGAGKQTVSYLLGVAIEYYLNNQSWDGFDEKWSRAVERVKEDEDFLSESDFKHIYFEGFADAPRIMLSQMLNIPTEWTYNDWMKDSVMVNLKDFEIYLCKDKLDVNTWKDKCIEATSMRGVNMYENHIDCWMSLRELIIYFGFNMQTLFGKDVWVKSLVKNQIDQELFFASKKIIYKIFVDTKFPTEISYIYDNGGYIIKVDRPDNKKKESVVSNALDNDFRWDSEITIGNNLSDIKEDIKSLTIKIIEK
jgi:hypothetical protein